MPTKRQKQLVAIALSHMSYTYDYMIDYMRHEIEYEHVCPSDALDELMLLDGKIVFAPSDQEIKCLLEPLKRGRVSGNRRTREMLQLALAWASIDIKSMLVGNAYEGTIEAHVDTHVSLDGINFRSPTVEELQDAIDDVGTFYQYYAPLYPGSIAWDVYAPHEDDEPDGGFGSTDFEHINTVFYDGDCDRDYVRRSLINHDGFHSQIEIVPHLLAV